MIMDYLAQYFPALQGNVKWAGACAALCFFSYLNIRGIQVSGRISVAMLIAVLLPVGWLCVQTLFRLHYNPFLPWTPPGQPFKSVFGAGLALAMWNYAGYEQLSSVTGEMDEPQKTFPRVLLWNTPLNILTLTLPVGLALAVLGNWQEWHTGYIVDAARQIGGGPLGVAMLVASVLAPASLSNRSISCTTRVPAAMAQDGYLPPWLGKLHPRYRTPANAIALSLVVYCVLARFQVTDLVNIYIWTRIGTSMLTVLAAWGLRRRMPAA